MKAKLTLQRSVGDIFFLSFQGFLFLIDYDSGLLFANIRSAGRRGFKFNRTVFIGKN